ncbi:MAG: hypothetical protein GX548_10935, partial [Lentisphaerae bacterium]|nr:hypothetical protein [Lentisphaerota bacterium]
MKAIKVTGIAMVCAQSAWAVITDFPHEESFEQEGELPVGWVSDPASGSESWACRTGVIDGPDADHTAGSGYFVRVNNWWRTTLESWLYLPPLDLSGMAQPAIAYWYCVGDETASGNEAYLYLEAKQGDSWVQVGTVKRWTPCCWIESLDSLSAHQSANTLLRFRVRTDSTATAEDVCIDDLRIFDDTNAPAMPNLQAPTHGATGVPVFATLRWEPRAGVTGYRLYVGTDGGGSLTPSNLHDGLELPGTASRYGLDDLEPSTTYYWQLVAVNAVGDGPASPIRGFTTGTRTTISSFPHTQDMSNGGNTPAGWINGYNDDGTGWVFSDFQDDHTTGSGHYAYVDVNYQKPVTSITSAFLTPRLDLSGTTYPKLSYWYRKDNSGNYLYIYVYYN